MISKRKTDQPGHSKKVVNELCNYLGEDLDSPMCKELQDHVEKCPECMEFINSIKMTVSIYRKSSQSQSLPPEIKVNLIKILQQM